MRILAVDTSSSVCGTALLENEKLIDENSLDNGKTHSENLMPLIKELLDRNKIELKDIDLYAVSVGPGSFTGIRIGVASVKAMAEVFNKPIAKVTSLESLARNDESDNNKITLIDAKNNQVYVGAFDRYYNLINDYMVGDINEILSQLIELNLLDNSILIGDGMISYKEIISGRVENSNIDKIAFSKLNKQFAVSTGLIGYKKYVDNNLENADTILPFYMRKSQAEKIKDLKNN